MYGKSTVNQVNVICFLQCHADGGELTNCRTPFSRSDRGYPMDTEMQAAFNAAFATFGVEYTHPSRAATVGATGSRNESTGRADPNLLPNFAPALAASLQESPGKVREARVFRPLAALEASSRAILTSESPGRMVQA